MRTIFLACVIFFSVPSSFAQSGNVGNGGVGGEPTFSHLRDLLVQWIELGAVNIDVRKSAKKVDWQEILDGMLNTVTVEFDPSSKKIQIDNSEDRACGNHTQDATSSGWIRCNLDLWKQTPEKDQLAVVFHEYLGALGYEPNSGGFSKYPLSSQLLGLVLDDQNSIKTHWTEKSIDVDSIQKTPTSILQFVLSLQNRKSILDVKANGSFSLFAPADYYSQTALTGNFLKNGDYLLLGNVAKKLTGVIGKESLKIK